MAAQAQVRRQRFPGEPGVAAENQGDALEHLALTIGLQRLRSGYSRPERAMALGRSSRKDWRRRWSGWEC